MEIWASFLLIQFCLRGLPQIFLLFDVLVKVQAIWKIAIQLQNTDMLCQYLTLELMFVNIWFNQCCSSSSEVKQNWTHNMDSCKQAYDSINVAHHHVKGNRIGPIVWTQESKQIKDSINVALHQVDGNRIRPKFWTHVSNVKI